MSSTASSSIMEKRIGKYQLGKEIGKGSFATVYKCVDITTNEQVAIKLIVRSKLKSKKLLDNLEIEIKILKSMKHPHIVGLLDYEQTTTHFHLIIDYCSMGDLSYFIKRRNQLVKTHPVISSLLERYPSPEGSHGLNQTLVIHFLKQLSSALQFLRDKSLVHRDIKPQNLLLCPPSHSKELFEQGQFVGLWELPILKIADFGFARFLPSTSMAETLCGSPLYMAPEILRYEKYNAKADLWSVGAVLFEMTVGKPPFRAANHIELLKNIEKANDRIKFPSLAKVPDNLKKLIRSLLKYNPTERISFNEFFNCDVIIEELLSNDKPLENSLADENLFISEYISPIKPHQKLEPLKDQETKKEEYESEHGSRDEEIKQLITKNSPDPGTKSLIRSGTPIKKDDAYLEKDYVVVEKRVVEVNAIADELANAGAGAVAMRNYSNSRRLSNRSNSSQSQRRPSLSERRISISISPSNALSKAIGLASNRLFGNANTKDVSILENENFNSPTFNNQLLLQKFIPISNRQNVPQSNDEAILLKLESLATKAHAVNLFADVKFSQLIPSPPSHDNEDEFMTQNHVLPPKVIKTIGEEGVVLYVKTLSLLAKGMAIASDWWYNQIENDITLKGNSPSPTPSVNSVGSISSTASNISVKINELVQWIREKFNESLEKAEFIKLRLKEVENLLSQDQILSDDSQQKVIAEKLIFDRALEMSRNAAVNELVKDDLKGCELAYSTSIWMLEALLDDEDGEATKLDIEDKQMIEKFIVSIGNRLSILKRKLEQ